MSQGGNKPAGTGGNVAEYTVSEISMRLKRVVETTFDYVRVRGEIGRVSRPASGHVYLDLKDEKAVLNGVIWKGVASRLRIAPEQGLEVVATGKLTTFPGQSRYQIVIETLEPAGVGALMALLEERKKKLAAEGLFEEARKKPRPFLPRVVGVITSPSGAVIRDMMHGFAERFPTRVLVWPVRVQGETSAQEVAAAVRGFNALGEGAPIPRPDLLIVARGGGSLEDLWGFNEEVVVRAVAESRIPVISAVGHETDWTLIDLAADARAPTPTKAAEWAVPKHSELIERLAELERRLGHSVRRALEEGRSRLRAAARGLPRPQDLVGLPRQRFDHAAARLGRALMANTQRHAALYARLSERLRLDLLRQRVAQARERLSVFERYARHYLSRSAQVHRGRLERTSVRLRPELVATRTRLGREHIAQLDARRRRAYLAAMTDRRGRLDGLVKLLASLSYQGVLARGYALVRAADGTPVRQAAALRARDRLEIEFGDGRVDAEVTGTRGAPGGQARASEPGKSRRKSAAPSSGRQGDRPRNAGDQGSLF